MENNEYLSSQIITYIGNKRALLKFIDSVVLKIKKELSKDKMVIGDLFSGSGIVSRYFKQYSYDLYVNDIEDYARTLNTCYLANKSTINFEELNRIYQLLLKNLTLDKLKRGFISKLYSPYDDKNIKYGERVFYTTRNAMYIDTARQLLEEIEEPYKTLLLGPLLYEASTKNNTAGIFKGFYKNSKTMTGQFGGNGKNALNRIMADIDLKLPVLSDFECNVHIFQKDTNKLIYSLPELDIVYLDPPYNQHPYGSNYFMLNLINNYIEPKIVSKVSGIPNDWNKSNYNKKTLALSSLEEICKVLKAKYILISFNSEGFITKKQMKEMLSKYGKVKIYAQKYNTFRGSRNLGNREIHVNEYLYVLKKE